MVLEDYKELVGTLASYAAVAQMLSGSLMCWEFHRNGTTRPTPAAMFVMGGGLGVVMLEFAWVMGDAAMLRANWAGMVLNAAYLLVYWWYAHDRATFYRWLAGVGCGAAAIIAYARVEDPTLVEHRLGLVVTVLLFMLVGLPLLSLPEIMKTRCSASIPLAMVVPGTVVTSLWLLYGIILENGIMIFQNVVFLAMSVLQLSLVIVYPRTPALVVKED